MTATPPAAEVLPPETVGVDPDRLDVLLRRARLEVDHGPLPSLQLAVARSGRLVAFDATIAARMDAFEYDAYLLDQLIRPIANLYRVTPLVGVNSVWVDADGTVLATERDRARVRRVDPATGEVTTVVGR